MESRDLGNLGRWRRGVSKALRDIEDVREYMSEGVVETLEFIFEEIGVRAHYQEEDATDNDVTDVDAACAALKACAASLGDAATLVKFAKDMRDTAIEDYDGKGDSIPRVTLSSIHKAKGLEWGTVYLISATPGVLPLSNAPVEEERRLFYVAQTRAKDSCFISWADLSMSGKVVGPSRFLRECGLIQSEDEDEDEEPDDGAIDDLVGEMMEDF